MRKRDRQVAGCGSQAGQRDPAENAAKAVRTARAEVPRGRRNRKVLGDGRHRVLWRPASEAIDLAGAARRAMPAAADVKIRLELGASNENWATPINRLETIPEPISNRVFMASQHSRGLLHGVSPVDLGAARVEPLHRPSPRSPCATWCRLTDRSTWFPTAEVDCCVTFHACCSSHALSASTKINLRLPIFELRRAPELNASYRSVRPTPARRAASAGDTANRSWQSWLVGSVMGGRPLAGSEHLTPASVVKKSGEYLTTF